MSKSISVKKTKTKKDNTPEVSKLTPESFAARLKQENLVTSTNFDDKLKSVNQKTIPNKEKYLLVKNKLKKVETFDSHKTI